MARGSWLVALAAVALLAVPAARCDVVVGNDRFTLKLDDGGRAKSLVVKETGEECMDVATQVPFFSVTQERPYNNENKLTHPNCRTTYPATKVVREGNVLVVSFRLVRYAAEIAVVEKPDYVLFELKGFRKADGAYGYMKIDRPPAVELRIADLPVRTRANYGEWLGVTWDDKAAVAVLGTSPDTFVDSVAGNGASRRMVADLRRGYRFVGGSAALVAAAGKEPFLECVDAFERDLGLPRGVANRRNPLVNASVFWVDDLLPSTVDEYIAYAKKGGFKLMLVYYRSLVNEEGHWYRSGEWALRKEYPNGYADVSAMLDKVRRAGIVPGLHFLQTHIGLKTSYVTPVPDHRLGLKRHYTLAKPLAAGATEVFVEESTADAPLYNGARVLRFGGELMSYTAYTAEPPYRFTGVRRGVYSTKSSAHPCGEIGGVLDISEFGAPDSCYLSQDSSLQDEIADKIAAFWKCGFSFLYMDGSEGVQAPFGRNVALSQYRVWKKLEPAPFMAEAAAKSHFGWHMLSGANAFDVGSPAGFKRGIVSCPLAEARLMAQDMTRVNFGWWGFWSPESVRKNPKKAPGTQLDMWEFGTSKAAAWDSPMTIQFHLAELRDHPRTGDLLRMIGRWEKVRETGWLTPERKKLLRDPRREFHLYCAKGGKPELVGIEMLPEAKAAKSLRGFVFERQGRRVVAYWDMEGASSVRLGAPWNATLSAGDLRYAETELPKTEVVRAFAAAHGMKQ